MASEFDTSEQELIEALVQADRAGDTEAATRIAAGIKRLRAQRAESDELTRRRAEQVGEMNPLEKMAVATGRGFMDVGQGIKQLGLQAGEALGLVRDGRATEYTREVEGELDRYEPLREDSPILTGGSRIVGNIAAMPIPVGRAATLGGNVLRGALAGGAQGGVQFVREGESRLANAAIGAAFGGAIPVLGAGLKLTVGGVRSLAQKLKASMPNATAAMRERAAAQMIRDAAQNPAALDSVLAKSSEIVPGTRQTLAEAADDVGLANAQRFMSAKNPELQTQLADLAQQNNAARVDAIKGAFGGADEAKAAAIEAARDQATAPLLAAARKVKGVDVSPTITLANRIIKAREGNDSVTTVLSRVRDILSREGMDTVEKLHNARQEIGNVLSGQSANEAAGRAASRELIAIRQSLDAQIGKASPEFRQFLKQYAEMSRDAGRVRVGGELLGKSAPNLDALSNPVLSPAKFANAADDLDRVARAATGFRKESADRLLTQGQKDTVAAVRADLDRVARLSKGLQPGSQTAPLLHGIEGLMQAAGTTAANAAPRGLAQALPIIGRGIQIVREHFAGETLNVLQRAMLDPQYARQILAKLPPAQRPQIQAMLQSPFFNRALSALGAGARGALVGGTTSPGPAQ